MRRTNWLNQFEYDPIKPFVASGNEAIKYFAKRDLLEEKLEPIEYVWRLPGVPKIIKKQQADGSWKYNDGKDYIRSKRNYDQLETYRILGQLVEKYDLDKRHPAIRKAANFLFSFQTEEGDFRGIYGNQYSPNYSAAIMELLIKAGYEEDSCIEKGFEWLLSIRQNDGGWAIPLRTVSKSSYGTLKEAIKSPHPIKPDKSKPFSHCITGVVLRAFAAHPKYRKTREAKVAGDLLKSRFFKPDKYPDRRSASYWTKFTFPFWFTDLVSALDSLSLLGFSKDTEIQTALEWLADKQQENGIWKINLLKTKSIEDLPLWISLAICRVFKRFYR